MTAPKIIHVLGEQELHALVECPVCELRAWLDEDQYTGRVSIDCPHCRYHQTHDLREDEHE